jgi:hypothetical protein
MARTGGRGESSSFTSRWNESTGTALAGSSHEHSSTHPRAASAEPKTARAPHLYRAIPAVAVMLTIGVLAFGSMLHRPSPTVEPVITEERSLAVIAPITDPIIDTE